jgi:hypothetical protein
MHWSKKRVERPAVRALLLASRVGEAIRRLQRRTHQDCALCSHNLPKGVSNMTKPDLKPVATEPEAIGEGQTITKPDAFDLNKFKSKHADAAAGVETLLTALPHHSISQAKDFVRLHHDEDAYWSPELCFVNVPIKGMKRDTLHLIDEDLAMQFLPSAKVLRFRLALAAKPFDIFFLC